MTMCPPAPPPLDWTFVDELACKAGRTWSPCCPWR
jgi:hypothetical protein